MLDLLVICLEAGLALNAALVRITKELRWTSPALSDELEYTNREIMMGRSRPEALRSLGQRCGHADFNALLAVIIQSEKFGMSLAKTLRIQVEAMRIKRRQKLQEAIHKMPVKMVFPLVFCIFPELLAVILGPAAIYIWQYYLKALRP
jgi:tight adherence protein C